MVQETDFMDIADRDFLGSRDYNDDINHDSEFDSDFEHYVLLSASRRHLFGRKRPLHVILGSGKVADVILWRKKSISTSVIVGVTLLWLFYVKMDYTLLSFTCDSLILLLAMLFLWSHLTSFINISSPRSSSFILPEGLVVHTAISITHLLNQLLTTFGLLASGHDLKTFLLTDVNADLSFYLKQHSLIGCKYSKEFSDAGVSLGTVMLLIVPAAYERTEDIVDILIRKAMLELNIKYAELMKKYFGYSQHLHEGCISPE
ncbi:reticulon-like protein B1 [Arachis hypogaea]|uniref:reticulon-like protein B1 n=1 Tax=Arachis hypogaea TaxID=3818 RepID=UPI000DEC0DA3|nr:reticulon-like protein B1 [Arachis hypogaea]